jgi:hypothetical protein
MKDGGVGWGGVASHQGIQHCRASVSYGKEGGVRGWWNWDGSGVYESVGRC